MAERVLVFSESFGLGHERAASALIKGMKTVDGSIEIMHTNSIRNSFPLLTGVFLRFYLQLINKLPHIWHRIYENGRKDRENESLKKMVYRVLAGNIKKTIREFKPDVIVCTHPFPAAVISNLKREGLEVPLAGVVTDYDIHAYWLDEHIDLYVIGDTILESDFEAFRFKPKRVSSTGIPIDPVFGYRVEKELARKKTGLDRNHAAVLVAGGGWGLGDLGQIAGKIAKSSWKPQVIIVTGTNSRLQKSLNSSLAEFSNVRVEGLVDNIHEYMMASDVMVTKPGGLTTSEGLASGTPMVLFDVIYGQEVWNARFLTDNGAALKGNSLGEISEAVKNIIGNPAVGDRLSEKALAVGKPDSGILAAQKIINLAV